MTSGTTAVAGVLADRYRLTARIAAGGMGEVWRAHDTVLDRVVAVKLLHADLADEAGRARFRAEARAAARLTHPGIASVYDFGESADQAWLVLELVDGEPLSAVLSRDGPLSTDRTLDVVAQAAAALQAAHDAGVVHRDVKPGNLLVRRDGVVKVTDFGIASSTGATTLTRAGDVLGTAGYLAPEQADGRGATAASDVYALGVVAYECLVRARPFVAEAPVAVLFAHLHTPVPEMPDHLPEPVRALVLQMLAKDPEARPAPAAAVSARAARLRPVAVRPSVTGGATTRQAQRRAVRATAVLLAGLTVVLGLRSSPLDGAGGREATDTATLPVTAADTARAQVPTITAGTPVAEAQVLLERAGLQPREQAGTSEAVAAGRVVTQRPAGGAQVARGSTVLLVVSSGPAAPPLSAVQESTDQDSTGRDSTGRDSTGRDSTGRDSTGRDRAGGAAPPADEPAAPAPGMADDTGGTGAPTGTEEPAGGPAPGGPGEHSSGQDERDEATSGSKGKDRPSGGKGKSKDEPDGRTSGDREGDR
jgi:serine/threonine-protein kinase